MTGEDNLQILGDRLESGDISIPCASMGDAVLRENTEDGKYRTLYIRAGADKFMFNLGPGRECKPELPFTAVKVEGSPLQMKNSRLVKVFVSSLAVLLVFITVGACA